MHTRSLALMSYLYIPLLLCLDICSFAFFEQPFVSSLLCLYIVRSLQAPSVLYLIFIWLGLLFESFLQYGRFAPTLMYLIPITIIALCIRHFFYAKPSHNYLLLALCLIMQSAIIEPYLFHAGASLSYIVLKIAINTGLMFLIL